MTEYRDYANTASGGVVKVPVFDVTCKHCGSKHIIRYGHYHGVQRFWCKDCKRKFADNDALPEMQTPIDQVGAAIGMFYEGQSLNSIRRLVAQIYHAYPSDSTVYRWVTRFTKEAVNKARETRPNVGDTWVADETVLDIAGRKMWFFDIIDEDTRFLLASRIAPTRTIKETALVMKAAYDRAGKAPKRILTDRMTAYPDGIERVFGANTKHVQSKPFVDTDSTNAIERFHGTLKDRTKVMRGLKDTKTAKVITDGFLLHYNYLRPHEGLGGKTPAEVAGVTFPYRNWQDVVAQGNVVTPKQMSVTSSLTIPELGELDDRPRGGRFKLVRKPHRAERGRRQKPVTSVGAMR